MTREILSIAVSLDHVKVLHSVSILQKWKEILQDSSIFLLVIISYTLIFQENKKVWHSHLGGKSTFVQSNLDYSEQMNLKLWWANPSVIIHNVLFDAVDLLASF